MDIESQINHIELLHNKWSEVLSFTLINNNLNEIYVESDKLEYLANLYSIPVTKTSFFSDHVWDYNCDVLNPASNIVGAKLRIDFSKYEAIPLPMLIEIKCILHYILLVPSEFVNKVKNRSKKKLKPNTVLARFKSGLHYLNHVMVYISRVYGEEFIKETYTELSHIDHMSCEKALINYEQDFTSKDKEVFFTYLTSKCSMNTLGIYIKFDYKKLLSTSNKAKSIEKNNTKAEISKIPETKNVKFSNNEFLNLVSKSTFDIVDFLITLGEKVEDQTALKHYPTLKEKYPSFRYSREVINDYSVNRLFQKKYPLEDISKILHVRDEFLITREGNRAIYVDNKKLKTIHNLDSIEDIRWAINEVYYSACYIVGQFTGMRPNVLAEVLISSCLITDQGDVLITSEEHKGSAENYNLFDDKWVAIPIIKDAIKVASIISKFKGNDYLFSNADTIKYGEVPTRMTSEGITHLLTNHYKRIFGEFQGRINPYMMRHTLAYQLHRADVGLPVISYQLKHIVQHAEKYSNRGGTSDITLGYGDLAQKITSDATKGKIVDLRKDAEIELIKTTMDPNGTYLGGKGKEHKERLQKAFNGYMASGYTEEQIYNAMADQGMAVINVGTGFCFGGNENFDESIPCIGSLRCNPNRCDNAIVTSAHAPKWREVYFSNTALLGKDGYEDRQEQIRAVAEEAANVLKTLGEEIIL